SGIRPDGGGPDAGDAGTPPIGNDVAPQPLPGGGTTGGPIDGRVNVVVFGGDTGAPIEGAFVQVNADGARASGRTDAGGVFTWRVGGLLGPVDVHAVADGYALHSVYGLEAANLSVVLRSLSPEPRPGTATVSGTIDLSVLPQPPFGESRSGAVLATLPPGGDASDLPPPGDGSVVYRSDLGVDEAYLLTTRTGLQAVYVVAGNADLGGSFEPTHFGILRGLAPSAGEHLQGMNFAPDLPLSVPIQLNVPGLPSGTEQLVAIPLVDLGAEGQAPLPPLAGGGSGGQVGSAPPLSGPLSGAHYDLVAVASRRGTCEDTPLGPSCTALPPDSTRLFEGLDAGAVASLNLDLLEPPVLSVSGGMLRFTRGSTVSLAIARFSGGTVDWDVVILGPDGNAFAPPVFDASAPIEAPSGHYSWRQDLLVVPGFDALEARFEEIRPNLTHISGDETDVDL
ncbi:MAG: carboxypeptidase regulatory-like domain-containing protein, partial [Deltaproteobacteria bacterium]